jgi:hypothetical protein
MYLPYCGDGWWLDEQYLEKPDVFYDSGWTVSFTFSFYAPEILLTMYKQNGHHCCTGLDDHAPWHLFRGDEQS